MIRYMTGDLFASDAEALVNTVNCVGIMGRGVALQFKKAFPENFRLYEAACKRGEVQPGRMFVTETGELSPRLIINFPTKRHWRGNSRMEDIDSGLTALCMVIRQQKIHSIAVPPLGSGLGGLHWPDVRSRIAHTLASLDGVDVQVFEPRSTDAPVKLPVRGAPPKLTPARGALVALIDRYQRGLMEASVTLLEVQKLSYFLQEAGQPLRLRFVKAQYGPYAENLRFVLRELEGHYTAGYGDGGDDPFKVLTIVPGALEAAEAAIADDAEVGNRFDRVARLVAGFETPVGLELLATALWVAKTEGAVTEPLAVEAFRNWNARKSAFTPRQIGIALDQLSREGWINQAAA
jgi:O-acetyl-ADP-ribose deacetylase (regulator of RNase III)